MTFDQLVLDLYERLETTNPDLIQRIRQSRGFPEGTLDGVLVMQLEDCILSLLGSLDNDAKRQAYNELADLEGLTRLDEEEVDFDYWIQCAFLDPVIEMLLDTDTTEN